MPIWVSRVLSVKLLENVMMSFPIIVLFFTMHVLTIQIGRPTKTTGEVILAVLSL